jgi:hypothetical protein
VSEDTEQARSRVTEAAANAAAVLNHERQQHVAAQPREAQMQAEVARTHADMFGMAIARDNAEAADVRGRIVAAQWANNVNDEAAARKELLDVQERICHDGGRAGGTEPAALASASR